MISDRITITPRNRLAKLDFMLKVGCFVEFYGLIRLFRIETDFMLKRRCRFYRYEITACCEVQFRHALIFIYQKHS